MSMWLHACKTCGLVCWSMQTQGNEAYKHMGLLGWGIRHGLVIDMCGQLRWLVHGDIAFTHQQTWSCAAKMHGPLGTIWSKTKVCGTLDNIWGGVAGLEKLPRWVAEHGLGLQNVGSYLAAYKYPITHCKRQIGLSVCIYMYTYMYFSITCSMVYDSCDR